MLQGFRPKRSVYWVICHVKCSQIPRSWFRDVAMSLYSITTLEQSSISSRHSGTYNSASRMSRINHNPLNVLAILRISLNHSLLTSTNPLSLLLIAHIILTPWHHHNSILQVIEQVTIKFLKVQGVQTHFAHVNACPTMPLRNTIKLNTKQGAYISKKQVVYNNTACIIY